MEHPFFPTTTTRAEALRWLTIAEKLLSTRDLLGSKSFASRARDSDPSLTPADQILAVAETLLAGDRRIGNNQHDWYSILRIPPQQGRDTDLIANQYRSLALLLNPQKNRFAGAEEAFRLVQDAWSVLSNPLQKSVYDRQLAFYLHPQPMQQQQLQPDPFSNPIPTMHQNFMFFGGSSSTGLAPAPAPAPQTQGAAVHLSQAQVYANPQPEVDPVGIRSTREPQNFMSFNSNTNIDFGSGSASGSKPVPQPAKKQKPENYSTFSGSVAAAPGATQGQVNSNNPYSQQLPNYSERGDKTSNNANLSENVGDRAERREDRERVDLEEERVDSPEIGDGTTMWTACPYCFYMYEYPMLYADCTLRCQNCKNAYQAVVIPSPPPIVDGREEYFCCWGFLPMGFSMENWEKNMGSATTWTPFSPMFTCPQPFNGANATAKKTARKNTTPRVYVDDDDEVFVEVSDSSESDDADWHKSTEKRKKKAKNGKVVSGGTPSKSSKKAQADNGKTVDVQDGLASENVDETANKVATESSKKGATINARKQPGRVTKNFGKLDLNVEFSNEPEESAPKLNQENRPEHGEEENIEGIGFFEGLDEFLSSLPILNVVGDEKVVKAA